MTVNAQKQKMSTKSLVAWIMTIGLPLAILLIPTNEVFTSQIRMFLAITIMAIICYAFDNVNSTVVSFLLPVLYCVFQLADTSQAFSPWTTTIPWLIIGGLIFANVLDRIGFLKRVAYRCIALFGGSYRGILIGLGVTGCVMQVIIPGQMTIPFAALSFGICSALNLGKSKASAGIMLTAAIGALLPQLIIYEPGIYFRVGIAQPATGPITIGWLDYFLKNAVTLVFLFGTILAYSVIFKPDKPLDGRKYFIDQYKALGTMSLEEKKGAVACALLLISLLTLDFHKIEAAWCFVMIAMLLFLPGMNIGTKEDLVNTDYGFLFFATACMSIGTVASGLGIGKIVSDAALPYLVDKSPSFFLIFVWLLCVVLNFLLTPLAVTAAFSLPLAQIAVDLGINPWCLHFVMMHGLDQIIFPYEYGLYLIYFSFGLIHLKDFAKAMGVKMLINGVFVVLLLIPFWKLVGFLYL